MKKSYGLIALALLLAAAPAFAQNPTLGLYWDLQGTQMSLNRVGGFDEPAFNGYVIAYMENVIDGAAFKLTVPAGVMVTGEAIPPGIMVGTALTGVQIALTSPQFGFYGNPVLIETITFWTGANLVPNGELVVGPYTDFYQTVLLVDHLGELYVADGLTSYLNVPVATENSTWGGVKDLYK